MSEIRRTADGVLCLGLDAAGARFFLVGDTLPLPVVDSAVGFDRVGVALLLVGRFGEADCAFGFRGAALALTGRFGEVVDRGRTPATPDEPPRLQGKSEVCRLLK